MADGRCHLCQPEQDIPTHDLLNHIRVMHPDAYGDGPDRWPDGDVVVIDTCPEPGEYTGGAT